MGAYESLRAHQPRVGDHACYVPAGRNPDAPQGALQDRPRVGVHPGARAHALDRGAPRLARDLSTRFKSAEYAAEELVAELGSAFPCAQLEASAKYRHMSWYVTSRC